MSDEIHFRVHFPDGYDRLDCLDLTAVIAAGGCRLGRSKVSYRYHVRFATPYEGLILVQDEQLSIEKAVELQAALAHFGVIPVPVTAET